MFVQNILVNTNIINNPTPPLMAVCSKIYLVFILVFLSQNWEERKGTRLGGKFVKKPLLSSWGTIDNFSVSLAANV